jgi:hypothetical protein
MIEKTGNKYAVAFPQWEVGQENKRAAKPSHTAGTLCDIWAKMFVNNKIRLLTKKEIGIYN